MGYPELLRVLGEEAAREARDVSRRRRAGARRIVEQARDGPAAARSALVSRARAEADARRRTQLESISPRARADAARRAPQAARRAPRRDPGAARGGGLAAGGRGGSSPSSCPRSGTVRSRWWSTPATRRPSALRSRRLGPASRRARRCTPRRRGGAGSPSSRAGACSTTRSPRGSSAPGPTSRSELARLLGEG